MSTRTDTRSEGQPQRQDHWAHEGVYVMSWEQLGWALAGLTDDIIHSGFQPEAIVPIALGGLVPGMHFHHVFPDAEIHPVRVRRTVSTDIYSPKTSPALEAWDSWNPDALCGKRVLVVDDVVGTGETMHFVSRMLRQANVERIVECSLVCNLKVQSQPEFTAFVVDDWVVFPWEVQPALAEHVRLPLEGVSDYRGRHSEPT